MNLASHEITPAEKTQKTPEELAAEGFEPALMTPEVAREIYMAGMKHGLQSMLKNDVLIYDEKKGYGGSVKVGVDVEDWPTIFRLINTPGSKNMPEPVPVIKEEPAEPNPFELPDLPQSD